MRYILLALLIIWLAGPIMTFLAAMLGIVAMLFGAHFA